MLLFKSKTIYFDCTKALHWANKQVHWLVGQSVCRSVGWSVGQWVGQSVSWSVGQSLYWRVNHSSIAITLTSVNYPNYPFSRSSSWSLWSCGNWLGLIINQEYCFKPLTIISTTDFSEFCLPLTHAFYWHTVKHVHSCNLYPCNTEPLSRGGSHCPIGTINPHLHLYPSPPVSFWAPNGKSICLENSWEVFIAWVDWLIEPLSSVLK